MTNISKAKYVGYTVLLIAIIRLFTFENGTIEGDNVRAKSKVRDWKSTIRCVPHYNQLILHRNRCTGNRNQNATTLSLIASYDYETYSVVTIQADGWFGRTIYCRYLDVNYHEIYPSIESFVFPEFAVHCCSRNSAHFLSVTRKPNDIITEYVTIIDRRRDEPIYSLSLCLAPMYGDERKWLLLVELVEHYKLQGVEHFYIYVKDMDDYTFKLIKHYEEGGIAEVIRFREYNDRPGQEWQLVGTEDCLQRSRHHSRYVIFHDLDERIIPAGNVTVKNLVEENMKLKASTAMIAFQGQRIERMIPMPMEYKGNESLRHHLPTLVFHKTSITPRSPKCAIDPRRVLVMWVHDVEVYFPGYTGYKLPAEKAKLRHYRDFSHDNSFHLRPIDKCFLHTHTAYPPELMPMLYRNVENTLNQVYGSQELL